jgi:hypothetical protein
VQKIDKIFEKFDTNALCTGGRTSKSFTGIKSNEKLSTGNKFFNGVDISFNLINVRGDGRCFFYALLQEIRDKFKNKNENDKSVEQNLAMKDTRMLEIYLLKNFIDPESKQTIKEDPVNDPQAESNVESIKNAILKTPITTLKSGRYVASEVYTGICNLFKNDFNIRILSREHLYIPCQNDDEDDDTKITVYLYHDGNHYQRMMDVQFIKNGISFRTEKEYNEKKAKEEEADTAQSTTPIEDSSQLNINKLIGFYQNQKEEEEKEEGITPMQAGAIITSIAAISIGVFMTVG